jgi:predicted RNA-binding protein YlxR (DUF448 family)
MGGGDLTTKKVPVRTCIVCGRKAPKQDLIRVVREPNGTVAMDATGRKSGRGAYLCPEDTCWQDAVNGGRLSHALRVEIALEDRERLMSIPAHVENASIDKEIS